MEPDCCATLVELGLNETEAAVYTCLLRAGADTGYGVANKIGKARANTLSALHGLHKKGAVIREAGTGGNGGRQVWRAIPPREWLDRLEHEFRQRQERAAIALSQLSHPHADAAIFGLASGEQVRERALGMLRMARRSVIATVTPALLPSLRPLLEEAAARRRVGLLLTLSEPSRVKGAHLAVLQGYQLRPLPFETLQIAVDGLECLFAYYDLNGTFLDAFWSDNPRIAVTAYSGAYCEWNLRKIATHLGSREIIPLLERDHRPPGTFGFRELARNAGVAVRRRRRQGKQPPVSTKPAQTTPWVVLETPPPEW